MCHKIQTSKSQLENVCPLLTHVVHEISLKSDQYTMQGLSNISSQIASKLIDSMLLTLNCPSASQMKWGIVCFLSDTALLPGIHACKAGDGKQELSLMEDPVLSHKLFTVTGAWNKSWKGVALQKLCLCVSLQRMNRTRQSVKATNKRCLLFNGLCSL